MGFKPSHQLSHSMDIVRSKLYSECLAGQQLRWLGGKRLYYMDRCPLPMSVVVSYEFYQLVCKYWDQWYNITVMVDGSFVAKDII